jgi:hypothetical protein
MTAARVPTPDDPGSPACTQVCRIVICDDQPELREAIGQILARNPHFAVVGQAHDGVSCLEQVEQTRPDLLILDVNMPAGGPHLAATRNSSDPNCTSWSSPAGRTAPPPPQCSQPGPTNTYSRPAGCDPLCKHWKPPTEPSPWTSRRSSGGADVVQNLTEVKMLHPWR